MSIFSKKSDVAAASEKVEKPEQVPAEKSAANPPVGGPVGKVKNLSVLLQPRISEKSSMLAKAGKYVFLVNRDANKIEVRKAVEQFYNVKVVNVNMVRVLGKSRTYARITGRMQDFKKAIVTLKPGDKIEGFIGAV